MGFKLTLIIPMVCPPYNVIVLTYMVCLKLYALIGYQLTFLSNEDRITLSPNKIVFILFYIQKEFNILYII